MVHIKKWMQIIFIWVSQALGNSQTWSALSQTWWDTMYFKSIAPKVPYKWNQTWLLVHLWEIRWQVLLKIHYVPSTNPQTSNIFQCVNNFFDLIKVDLHEENWTCYYYVIEINCEWNTRLQLQTVPRQGTSKSAKEWKKICLQNKIPPFVQKSLLMSIVDLPRFYHLIKTHKAGPNVKIRPIISNINRPTQRISWLLANALKPMLKNVPAQ